MKNWNGWAIWALACLLAQAAVATFSAAVIVHNPAHYGIRSLVMALLITLAVEIALTVVGLIAPVVGPHRRGP